MTELIQTSFFVEGHPEHQGNLVPIGRGRPGVRDKNAKKLHPWRDHIASRAREAYGGPPLDCPVDLVVCFFFERPAIHYGTGRNSSTLKQGVPFYRYTRPDIDKLLRGVLDALTGVMWSDDSRVVRVQATKRWVGKVEMSREGALIQISRAV